MVSTVEVPALCVGFWQEVRGRYFTVCLFCEASQTSSQCNPAPQLNPCLTDVKRANVNSPLLPPHVSLETVNTEGTHEIRIAIRTLLLHGRNQT
jgi:hypothetical protein